MRFSKYVPLLAAILPLTLAQYSAPPPPTNTTCSEGAHRCDEKTLQVCSEDSRWETIKVCSKTAYCFAQETANGGGDCYPFYGSGNMQCSTVNEHRCDTNSLQQCGDHGYWSTVKNCTKTAYCFAQETANGGGDCHPLILDNDKQCSTIDLHRCSTNSLEICGDHGYWKTAKNCTKTAYCFAQDTAAGGGDCYPLLGGLDEQCSVANEYRCDNNKLEICSARGYWHTVKECKTSETCFLNSKFVDGGLCVPTPPKDNPNRCETNKRRCYDNKIQGCGPRGYWGAGTDCGSDNICIENCNQDRCKPYCLKRTEYYTVFGDTDNSSSSDIVSTVAHSKLEPCDRPGIERCMYDYPVRTQLCTNGTWLDAKICPLGTICWADNDGDETAECAEKPDSPPPQSNDTRAEPAEPCCPGAFTCDANLYSLLVCNDDQKWHTSKKCLTPGDCMIDGPEQAHCEKGEMEPPKTKRAVCNPGDMACDKDRRFWFACDDTGNWDTPAQCFGPGYCRPEYQLALTCAGFPLYGGDDGKCDSYCESMEYLYCIGGSWHSPEKIRKCLEGMCQNEDCRACDRCNFKLPYGVKPQPDLNTLVPEYGPN